MREIKFRAWLKVWDENEHVKGKMFYNILPTNNSLDEWIISFYDDDSYDGDFKVGEDILLMQYTGLKDKNGREIFEGDVVEGKISHFFGREVVKYEGGGFSPFAIPGWEVTPKSESVEVIGNIYENPNLLKG